MAGRPGVSHLLAPKARAAARRFRSTGAGRGMALIAVGVIAWALLFAVLYRMLLHFQGAEGIGDALAGKLLALVFVACLAILLLSNVITALSTFFLARDLELLVAAPVDGLTVYLARLVETTVHSSWMVALVAVPVLSAYGIVYGGGGVFVLAAGAAFLGLVILAAVAGTAFTLFLVNVFPARRARDLLALVALFAAAAMVLLLRVLRPERLAGPDGFRDLVHFVAELNTPSSPWLASDWAADAVMASLGAGAAPDWFPLLLLLSTAAAFLVLGAALHGRMFAIGFSRAQEGAERPVAASGARGTRLRLPPRLVPVTIRSLVSKDVRTFFRDTTQWSQLILLAVLMVVYVYNIRALPLRTGEDVGFFLVNAVAFLNLGLAGFVLAAVAARFLFPAVSLEGRTLWLLRSSPLDLRRLVWCKYWVGVAPLLVLALALTLATNAMLEVGTFVMVVSLAAVTVMSFALAAMALGFGAVFPRFDTENAAQIPTGFGGVLFMLTATAYLAIVIVALAWPVYGYLQARLPGGAVAGADVAGLIAGFGFALMVSGAAIVVPLRIAVRRMTLLEP